VDRNRLLCCHEHFWRAIKDKTKWYPSNKEQPPWVTVLWQHRRGGLQALCVCSHWARGNSGSNSKMNLSVATFRPSKRRDMATHWRSVIPHKNGILIASMLLPDFTYVHPVDTERTHVLGRSWGVGIWISSNTRRVLLGNLYFKSCSFKVQKT
jgi:hypothetical protein